MHTKEHILAQIKSNLMLEIEGRKLLKLVHDRHIADCRKYGRSARKVGRLKGEVALRIAQYGALRAYWERQAKKLATRTKQSHV